jgi:hypothetical protein
MKRVFSSYIEWIGYDDKDGSLHVQYQNGKTSIYENVPMGTAMDVINAPSVGTAIHSLIRGKFSHKYLGV